MAFKGKGVVEGGVIRGVKGSCQGEVGLCVWVLSACVCVCGGVECGVS